MNSPDHSCVLEQTHKPNGQRRRADDATPDPQMSALTYLHTDAGRGRVKESIFGIEEQKEGGQKNSLQATARVHAGLSPVSQQEYVGAQRNTPCLIGDLGSGWVEGQWADTHPDKRFELTSH